MPFDIQGHGWELKVTRLGLQTNAAGTTRTYGSYQVFVDGQAVLNLSGHICEAPGPGDNGIGGKNHSRIEQGRYALSTQFGNLYRSVGFSNDETHPMPGFQVLLPTHIRDGILVHPGHHPKIYLSSIGCFNPTNPLTANQVMDFDELRARLIAMIDSLKQHDPNAFAPEKIGTSRPFAGAFMVVDGEPMAPLAAAAVG